MAAKKKTKVEEEVKNEVLEEVKEVKNEVKEPVKVEEPVKELTGVVSNCTRLNVRRQPSKEAKVKSVIDSGTEVIIINKEMKGEWYKVSTKAGDIGFCMAKYITVNK